MDIIYINMCVRIKKLMDFKVKLKKFIITVVYIYIHINNTRSCVYLFNRGRERNITINTF